jgi:segregation and condensation protein B
LRPGLKWADIRRDVEALLFAAGEPVKVDAMLEALGLDDGGPRQAVEEILDELATEFPAGGPRGFELAQLAGGWAFRTNSCSQDAVKAMFELPAEAGRLSPAAMECLAIVAYLQPVTRPQIAEVRGVNCDSPIHTLLDRELIGNVGRASGGKGAVQYATTPRFEAMFGLAELTELPPLEGFALTDDEKAELRRRLGLLTVPE